MDRKTPPHPKPLVKLGDRIGYRSSIVTITGYFYKKDGYEDDGVTFSVPGEKEEWSGSFDHMERLTGRKFDKPKKTRKTQTDQGIIMENIERIKIADLRRSPKNVRKTNLAEDRDKLVADITTRGLLQNLIGVRGAEDGKPVVFILGGGRRMDALIFIRENDLTINVDGVEVAAKDYEAPVRIFPNDDDAEEASLMENIQRVNMTAVDQYRAWSAMMKKEGLTAKKLAQRTGQDFKYVERCLALGGLEPSILDEVASGVLDLDAAKALTMAGSHERQLEVLKTLRESPTRYSPRVHAWEIRQALTTEKVAGNSALGAFVYQDYVAKGLPVTKDLFSDQTSILLDDPEQAKAIALARLEAKCADLKEQGWAWAEAFLSPSDAQSWKFSYEQPEIAPKLSPEDEARKLELIQANEAILEKYPAPDACSGTDDEPEPEDGEEDQSEESGDGELGTYLGNGDEGDEGDVEDLVDWSDEDCEAYNDNEAEISEIDRRAVPDWTPEQRAGLGCFVSIGPSGGFHIQPGFRPRQEGDGANDKGTAIVHPDTVIPDHAKEKEDENPGLSDALMRDLSAQRTLALQVAMMDDPEVCLSLHLYTLWGKVQCQSYISTPTNISANLHLPTSTKTDTRLGEAAKRLADRAGDFSFLKGNTGPGLFRAIHTMSAKERKGLLAYLTARTVDAPMAPTASRNPIAELIGGMLKVNVRDTWTPEDEEFWGRVSKAWIEDNAPQEIAGGVRMLAGEKKAGRVASLHKWFQNPEAMRMTDIGLKQDKPLDAKRVKAIANWLPPGMAFEQPAPVKTVPVDENEEVEVSVTVEW